MEFFGDMDEHGSTMAMDVERKTKNALFQLYSLVSFSLCCVFCGLFSNMRFSSNFLVRRKTLSKRKVGGF